LIGTYFALAIIVFLLYTHPKVMQNIHPHLRNILEFDANPNIKTKACIKIKTKWEEELYNDKVV